MIQRKALCGSNRLLPVVSLKLLEVSTSSHLTNKQSKAYLAAMSSRLSNVSCKPALQW